MLALFDLDHTLLTLDSDEAWVEFLIEEGTLDRAKFERANHDLVSRYRAGEATSVEFTYFYLSTLVGRDAVHAGRVACAHTCSARSDRRSRRRRARFSRSTAATGTC